MFVKKLRFVKIAQFYTILTISYNCRTIVCTILYIIIYNFVYIFMYNFVQGGEEKKLDKPAWTEESWGLTDYTLKCRAELPSQNLTTLYVVDRTGQETLLFRSRDHCLQ